MNKITTIILFIILITYIYIETKILQIFIIDKSPKITEKFTTQQSESLRWCWDEIGGPICKITPTNITTKSTVNSITSVSLCDTNKKNINQLIFYDLGLTFKTIVNQKELELKNYASEKLLDNIARTINNISSNKIIFTANIVKNNVYDNMQYYYNYKSNPITTNPITTNPITTNPITTNPITTNPITTSSILPKFIDEHKINEFIRDDKKEIEDILKSGNQSKKDRLFSLIKMMIHIECTKKNKIYIVLIPTFYDFSRENIIHFKDEKNDRDLLLLQLYNNQYNRYNNVLESINYRDLDYNWIEKYISDKNKLTKFIKEKKVIETEKIVSIKNNEEIIANNNVIIKQLEESKQYINYLKQVEKINNNIKRINDDNYKLTTYNYLKDIDVIRHRKFRGKVIHAELFPELMLDKEQLDLKYKDKPKYDNLVKEKKKELIRFDKKLTYKELITKQINFIKRENNFKIGKNLKIYEKEKENYGVLYTNFSDILVIKPNEELLSYKNINDIKKDIIKRRGENSEKNSYNAKSYDRSYGASEINRFNRIINNSRKEVAKIEPIIQLIEIPIYLLHTIINKPLLDLDEDDILTINQTIDSLNVKPKVVSGDNSLTQISPPDTNSEKSKYFTDRDTNENKKVIERLQEYFAKYNLVKVHNNNYIYSINKTQDKLDLFTYMITIINEFNPTYYEKKETIEEYKSFLGKIDDALLDDQIYSEFYEFDRIRYILENLNKTIEPKKINTDYMDNFKDSYI